MNTFCPLNDTTSPSYDSSNVLNNATALLSYDNVTLAITTYNDPFWGVT
jgi:hypothetical protein